MKVLWMCNVKIPRISRMQNEENCVTRGGWLEGLSSELIKTDGVEIIYCYPEYGLNVITSGSDDNFTYYAIPMTKKDAEYNMSASSKSVKYFETIISSENPDVYHFFGTEFIYTSFFIDCVNKRHDHAPLLISIQGLISIYAQHYFGGIPCNIIKKRTISEIKNRSTLRNNQKKFEHRGKYEQHALKSTPYIIGRTSWDLACTDLIAPKAQYYSCNETLRNEFYTGQWYYKTCNKYQIIISQGAVPYKGLHVVVDALKYIIHDYPIIKVVVAGDDVFSGNIFRGSTYGNYVKELISKYNLQANFDFVGNISAQLMKETMINSNLFICPSMIENSPNSLGEAMLLGMPCIASDVGGVQDMMKKDEEGFVYPFNESYKLSYYIKKIFNDPEKAIEMGRCARKHAKQTHNPEINNKRLLEIYGMIIGK